MADADVYTYFQSKGAKINNSIEDYQGTNGCFVYGKAENRTSLKFKKYDTDYVTLGMHKGFIPSDLWLSVQMKFEQKMVTVIWEQEAYRGFKVWLNVQNVDIQNM